MEEDAFRDIKKTIAEFQYSLQQQLPALEVEVNAIVRDQLRDKNTNERTLDTLLSLTDMGVGKDLFIVLLNYYKTIDAERHRILLEWI